jgi:hypothetical protein
MNHQSKEKATVKWLGTLAKVFSLIFVLAGSTLMSGVPVSAADIHYPSITDVQMKNNTELQMESLNFRSLITQSGYNLIANNFGRGIVDRRPDKTFHNGELIRLAAPPASGWSFNGLSGNLTSTTPVVLTPTPSPACFLVSSLLISPQEADSEETVRIWTVVKNNGGEEGTCELVLKINGVEDELKRIRVAAGKTENVSFEVKREHAGQYAVEVNGKTGQFKIMPARGTISGLVEDPETSLLPSSASAASLNSSLASGTPSTSGSDPEKGGKAPALGWVLIGVVILCVIIGIVIMTRRKN